MRSSRPILLLEDDSLDAMTVKRALKEIGLANQLIHTANGEQALEYLRSDRNDKPYIIIIDLNMPKMNGLEFLKIAKADEQLKNIPAVVLTTSKNEHDICESFRLGVAGYIIKPPDYQKFVEAITIIDRYWTLSQLPDGE